MMIVKDTESNCKYFSGGDYKRCKMLFELLYHPIDKHLPYSAKDAHKNHVPLELIVLK